MRSALLLLAFAIASFTDAVAQQLPLQPGQRVRVTAPSRHLNMHQETFQQVRGDTLVLESMWLALSDVTRLEVWRRTDRSRAQEGVTWGILGGMVLGGIIGYVGGDSDCRSARKSLVLPICFEKPLGALLLGFVGIPVGALVGSGVGSVMRTQRGEWSNVPLDRLRVSVVPTRTGFGLGASIAF